MTRRGIILLTLSIRCLYSERLPVRNYSAVDGLLADSAVFDISEDTRGYLWMSQPDGLTRFDGVNFKTYGIADGLPPKAEVNQTLSDGGGGRWVATDKGLARYDPRSQTKLFTTYRVGDNETSNVIYRMAPDGRGGVWLGTFAGLYHAVLKRNSLETRFVLRPEAPAGTEPSGNYPILSVIQDRDGVVWAVGHYCGIYRILPGGQVLHYTAKDGLPSLTAGILFQDHRGQVWLASAVGLLLLNKDPDSHHPFVLRRVDTKQGHPENGVRGVDESADGHLWMATVAGLLEFDGDVIRPYSHLSGLPATPLWSVHMDRAGDLWLGSSLGIACLNTSGISSFTEEDGMPAEAPALYRTRSGEIAVVTHPVDSYSIQRWDGRRFHGLTPQFPPEIKRFGWGWGNVLLQDHTGDWWVATYDGLCRFSATAKLEGLAHAPLKKRYTTADGLPSNNIHSLYEDAKGDIWIGCMFPPEFGLARWNRSKGKFEDMSHTAGITSAKTAMAFWGNGTGDLWVGFLEGGLSRMRNNRFETILSNRETVNSLQQDSRGVLWAGTTQGLLRIDNPRESRPKLSWLTKSDGLSSSDVLSVMPEANGRLFVGTGQGLDELDPANSHVTHFHRSDGLAGERIVALAQDNEEQIWIGTISGLSVLKPKHSVSPAPPSAWISEVRVGSDKQPLSDLGEIDVSLPKLAAWQNSVQISYAGISNAAGSGRVLRYRYRLLGSGVEWSHPSREETVTYPNLTPGDYTFEVKAEDVLGRGGDEPASVRFLILSPYYKRWWFISAEVLVGAAMLFMAYRFRMEQVLRIERIREGIARDLHDEVGSSLTQIAVLIEVARSGGGEAAGLDPLGRAATVARESTASMGDIVWAINPNRDSLDDLAIRIRRYAGDVLGGAGIGCVVKASSSEVHKLDSDFRRQLLLVAKEAVHNAARHSCATSVKIDLSVTRGAVTLRVEDDGVGFDPGSRKEGHGIESMSARVRKLGGGFRIEAGRGAGVVIECRLPPRKQHYG